MGEPVRILIARHGETEWNLEGRFQGHRDSPLTPRGREQSARLAERLSAEPVSAIYCSDLGRARETAAPIGQRLGLLVHTSPLLREIDCGLWTGQAKREIRRHDPDALERYRVSPSSHRMPQGESLAEVQERGARFLQELPSRHVGETLVVITHHIVVETLLARALGIPLTDLWLTIPTGNCYLSELQLAESSLSVLTIYDGSHLGVAAHTYFEGDRVA